MPNSQIQKIGSHLSIAPSSLAQRVRQFPAAQADGGYFPAFHCRRFARTPQDQKKRPSQNIASFGRPISQLVEGFNLSGDRQTEKIIKRRIPSVKTIFFAA
jgi:hypothetical protein